TLTNINNALNGLTYNHPNGNDNTVTLTITTNDGGNSGTGGAQQDVDTVQIKIGSGPAGISGEPINLGLTDPSVNHGATVDVTLVFSQPIGSDLVNSFDVAHDKVDLIGYQGFTSFADVQAHLVNDSTGNAALTLADGQSITFAGVDASALTAGNFEFDVTPG